ncbi:MAG: hypothetical protein ACLFNM_03735 [Candidatus Woesearchaeota archaeon]
MDSLRIFSKKGQAVGTNNASSAAFLVLIIAVLIVVYILFLPAADREALLGSDTVPGTTPGSSDSYTHLVGSVPLNVQVGSVDYISQSQIEHNMNSFRVFTQTDASIIEAADSVYVKHSAYQTKVRDIPFLLDPSVTENVLVSFNVQRADGMLSIFLNGELIFEGNLETGSPAPIILPQRLLKQENVLHFTVSSPGFAFWRVNEYELTNLQITGDVTDVSNNVNAQKIYLAESEFEHLDTAEFSFFPDCTLSEVDMLTIRVNGNELFSGTPDCGLTNHISLGKQYLVPGENTFTFETQKGSYIIDGPQVEVDLQDPEYPIYYFNLHEDLFTYESESSAYCGKIDGICLDGCEPYEDKDCCFDESNDNYWCDVRPNNPRDRCVNEVLASFSTTCVSGYEDVSGNPHEDVQNLCGDDTDGFCPTGCSADYDKDCCYENNSENYWCEDTPTTGVAHTCTNTVTPSECGACYSGYKQENGDAPNCPNTPTTQSGEYTNLKAGVDIILESFFTDDSYKKVDFNINGNILPIDTYALQLYRNINIYVHEGVNSIQVQPRNDITLSQLRVKVQ